MNLKTETETPEQEHIACREAMLLKQLEGLKQKLIALNALPQRSQYAQLQQGFADQQAQLRDRHQQNKADRKIQRQTLANQADASLSEPEHGNQLAELDELSRRDGRERRALKQQRDQALAPLIQAIAQADAEMVQLKQRYRALSQQLQTELRQAYRADCIALATSEVASETHGSAFSLQVLHEDDLLIAIDKPAGLLSVPGRAWRTQDSAFSRLQHQRSDLGSALRVVHRLDQDTSGILLFAKNKNSQRYLQAQFQQQRVAKAYEALLDGDLTVAEGQIDLPLAADPEHRPRQRVDHHQGKLSQTRFWRIAQQPGQSRVRFAPQTGRTHQLRVHAAVGLGLAIVGDRLYGKPLHQTAQTAGNRLYLHACKLRFCHPATGGEIELRSLIPF